MLLLLPILMSYYARMPDSSDRLKSRVARVNQAGKTAAERLGRRRFVRKLRRGKDGAKLRSLKGDIGRDLLKAFAKQGRKVGRDKKKKYSKTKRIELKEFSLISNPTESLEMLALVASAVKDKHDFFVDFTDHYCKDIGAYVLFALMRQGGDWRGSKGGKMSTPVGKVLRKLGFTQLANMSLPRASDDDVWPIKLEIQLAAAEDENRGLLGSKEEKSAVRLAENISGWLKPFNAELTREGKARFMNFYAEVVDNARHAGIKFREKRVGRWAVGGFMARRHDPAGEEYWCHLAFMTAGSTIAESLLRPRDTEVKNKITKYAKQHVKKYKSQDLNALISVAAIQDGISSDKLRREGGGTGIGTLLSNLGFLAGNNSGKKSVRITIISGDSCVLLHPPYNSLEGLPGSASQWFNSTNTEKIAPDPKHVMKLPFSVPGTIITLKFMLDAKEVMQAASQNRDQEDD